MAVEKIKPLKMGELADGEPMTDLVTTEVDPTQDYAAVKGVAFENTDSTLIDSVSGNIQFTTNTLERARIDTSGNVGINTTTPGSTLDVKGTLRLSGSTSGYIGLSPAATAGSTTYTLPSADGNDRQVLSTNAAGTLSWQVPVAQYQYAESLTNSSTTSTTFQTKVTLTTPTIPAGTYRVGWTYAVSHGTADRRSEERIVVDGTQVYIVDPEIGRTGAYWPGAGFDEVTFGSAASHTITLQYRRQSASSFTVNIKEARLEIWRVA